MARQSSDILEVTFEYEDGYVDTRSALNGMRGIRHAGNRPYYAELRANIDEDSFKMMVRTRYIKIYDIFFKHIIPAMSAETKLNGRVTIKPDWLHKLLVEKRK